MAFEFVLTTDEIREKMFDFLKSNDILCDVMNTDWTGGVYDKKSGIFLILVDYATEFLTRCGGDYYGYAVIRDNDVFMVDFYKNGDKISNLNIPDELNMLSEIIMKGVGIYESRELRREFEKNMSSEEKQKIVEIQWLWEDKI